MKRGIRILAGIMIAVVILSGMTFTSFAGEATNFTAISNKKEVKVGETFELRINVKQAMSIVSLTGGISFDNSVIQYVKFRGNNGDESTNSYLINSSGNYISVSASVGQDNDTFGLHMVGTSEASYRAGNILTITFKALKTGDPNIRIYEDSDGSSGHKASGVDPSVGVSIINNNYDQCIYNLFGASSQRRLAGSDRYATAMEAVNSGYKKALGISQYDNVVVACGSNFPDALAGGYLAKVKNAPILLVSSETQEAIANQIRSNMKAGGTVYILGGPNAVPQSFVSSLNNRGIYNINRLSGDDRYQTNIKILKEAGVKNEDILLCTGKGYADSLSASAAGIPILLVGDSLTNEQRTYLGTIKPGAVYVIGGTVAVGNSVVNQVKSIIGGYFKRISGADRYQTSQLVASEFFKSANVVALAYGANFPDGLSGGPIAMALNAPIVLASNDNYGSARSYARSSGAKKAVVFGGGGLISDSVVSSIIS